MCIPLLTLLLAADPVAFKLDPALPQSVKVQVVHPMHHVTEEVQEFQGAARLLPDGTLQAMVRAKINSFNSGNANRDEHMRETVEATKFPDVVVKAVLHPTPPTAFPGTVEVPATMDVNLHGVSQKVSAPVKLVYKSASEVTVEGSFPVSLEGFKISRPSLLFTPIEDRAVVEFRLGWRTEGGDAKP
jgi:polyisoprenoid-binding protein YceI